MLDNFPYKALIQIHETPNNLSLSPDDDEGIGYEKMYGFSNLEKRGAASYTLTVAEHSTREGG